MRNSGFAWNRMESDVGFGFRFNARDKTFLRLDVGFVTKASNFCEIQQRFQKRPGAHFQLYGGHLT